VVAARIIKLIFILLLFLSCQKSNYINLSMTPLQRGTVMDPARIYFLNEYYVIENLTVRLVEMDTKVGYKFMLASSIDQKTDTEFHVKIKETSFSNGDPVTLLDVQNSFKRAMTNKSSHIPFGEIVESLEIQGNALIIKLKKRVNDFMYYLTLADLSVLHSSQINKKEILVEDWEIVSSGPYTYSVEGDDVFLVQNPHYKLSPLNYPKKVKLLTARGRDTFSDFKNEVVDFGEFNLNSYERHLSEVGKLSEMQIIGNTGDMISFLALNADNVKFKNAYNRKWLQKKILLEYSLDQKYKNVARKAFQFFTPQVRGFVEEKKIIDLVKGWSDIDTSKVPEDLKNGITIHTYQRAFEVTLKGAVESLESILGIPVKIEATVPSVEFEKFIKKKDYEIFLGVTSMDQVIVGESINLYYFSSSPMFKDVNGKIKELMSEYQKADVSKTLHYLQEIAFQMVDDSECIPVFYVASPFFYNKSKLDISDLDEMTYFNLWKIKEI